MGRVELGSGQRDNTLYTPTELQIGEVVYFGGSFPKKPDYAQLRKVKENELVDLFGKYMMSRVSGFDAYLRLPVGTKIVHNNGAETIIGEGSKPAPKPQKAVEKKNSLLKGTVIIPAQPKVQLKKYSGEELCGDIGKTVLFADNFENITLNHLRLITKEGLHNLSNGHLDGYFDTLTPLYLKFPEGSQITVDYGPSGNVVAVKLPVEETEPTKWYTPSELNVGDLAYYGSDLSSPDIIDVRLVTPDAVVNLKGKWQAAKNDSILNMYTKLPVGTKITLEVQ